jgi:three-Cys-motif partner protein
LTNGRAAVLVPGVADVLIASDGLPARVIKPHSRDKSDRHEKYCGILGGMKGQWALGYLELFAGPGLTIDHGEESDGCPLVAARPDTHFERMAFVEYDPELAAALETRLRRRGFGPDRALVLAADANDPAVLSQAMDFLPAPGLIFAFIDPEDINGDWRAVQLLSSRRWPERQAVDFLINLPVGSMKRNYSSDEKITRVLGTDEWRARVDAGEKLGPVFRETYAEQFKRIGFTTAEHMEVRAYGSQTPVYDLVFASRHPKGLEFWQKIQKIQPSGQRTLPY